MARPLLMTSAMTKTFIGMGLLLGLGVLAGCAAEDGDGAGSKSALLAENTCTAEGSARPSAISINGTTLNGWSLNGIGLNGAVLNGLTFNGLTLNGLTLNGLTLNGTTLNGTTINGTTLNGLSLNGAKFNGTGLDGSSVAVYIDEVRANPDAKNADVTLYALSIGEKREPFCGLNDDGTRRFATAIANVWDEKTGARIDTPDRFTFACEGGALYKCVAAGYKPWKSAEMAEYHQACTRMIRADYCGDGLSYTKNGTVIDMNDALGVQSFETQDRSDFALEATWGPNGATCVAKTRFKLTGVPSCLADRLQDSCDVSTPAEGGVRLANRSAKDNACLR